MRDISYQWNFMKKTILVTGGAGYIGSHTCVELLLADYEVIVIDNLMNSKMMAIQRVEQITEKNIVFYPADVTNKEALQQLFTAHKIDAVIHFAGLKAVGESCQQPLKYYQNNVNGTLVLLDVMAEAGVDKFVFSSSATVYGDPAQVPIDESFPLSATNPYGRSKLMVEDILRDMKVATDLQVSSLPWKIALLRYFNPVGAHPSGLIGEDPNGIPNNLMPFISQVAIGKRESLSVFGGDYPTADGTGVRDYIHVVDLAKGHLKALEALDGEGFSLGGCEAYNLGTGQGYSVLEMLHAFEATINRPINYQIVAKREGDIAECYAKVDFAQQQLNWKAEKNLTDMMEDTWRWQQNNPEGYL